MTEGLGSNLCNRLKLWHVEVPGAIDLGYDSYDSFVVACYTEEEARNTSPNGSVLDLKDRYGFYGWVKFDDIPKLVVTEIGYAKDGIKFRDVIIASFNAG